MPAQSISTEVPEMHLEIVTIVGQSVNMMLVAIVVLMAMGYVAFALYYVRRRGRAAEYAVSEGSAPVVERYADHSPVSASAKVAL